MLVRQESDSIYYAKTIQEGIVPVFYVSNLDPFTLDPVKKFLNMLPYRQQLVPSDDDNALFLTHNKFLINGKIVFTGFLHKGTIRKHQRLFLGPLNDGSFV
jgi:GTPase